MTTMVAIPRHASFFLKVLDELEAVFLRHHQVENDRLRSRVSEPLEADAAVLGFDDFPPRVLERAPNELACSGIVLHDEDRPGGAAVSVLAENVDEALRVDGLGHVLRRPEREAHLLSILDRDHHYRDLGELGVGLQPGEHGPPSIPGIITSSVIALGRSSRAS